MSEYSDQQIMEMFGDENDRHRAFSLLVEKYSKRIYWTVRKIVISHQDTDDLVQNIFVKLWSSLEKFRGESGLYTWIHRIAVNEALSFLRSAKRRPSINDSTAYLESVRTEQGLADGDAITNALNAAILELPEKQRVVFNLRYYDEMPYKDMAEVLNTSEGALKASYHHAVKKIEDALRSENFLDDN